MPVVKGVDTALALVAILLIASTYYLLIRRTSSAGSTNRLPAKALAANIQWILEETWNQTVSSPFLHEEPAGFESEYISPNKPPFRTLSGDTRTLSGDTRRLLYLGHNLNPTDPIKARGYDQCDGTKDDATWASPLVPIATESTSGKNAISLVVWEWVSMWLVAIMIVNTAVYNGFVTSDANPDRFPRLALTTIYGAVFLLHFAYTWSCFCSAYTCLVLNGCWTLLANAKFGVSRDVTNDHTIEERLTEVNATTAKVVAAHSGMSGATQTIPIGGMTDKELERLTGIDVYQLPLMGPSRLSETYWLYPKDFWTHILSSRHPRESLTLQKIDRPVSDAQQAVRSMQEAEIKVLEKATEAALDRVLFNATVLLSISIVTGFSTWTQSQLRDATSTQLGSLALLVSTGSGIGAMLSSSLHMGSVKSSPRRFLKLMEVTVSGKTRPAGEGPDIGFTRSSSSWEEIRHKVNIWNLIGTLRTISQIPMLILFGPAYVLLPSPSDDYASSPREGTQFTVKLGETPLSFHYKYFGRERVRLAVDKVKTAEPPASSPKGKERAAPESENNAGDRETVLEHDIPDLEDGIVSDPK